MSKEDYAKLFIYAPSRLVLGLVLAFGGGLGVHLIRTDGGDIRQDQRELDICLSGLAYERAISHQHAKDVADISDWASGTLRTLSELQQLEALRNAPNAYSSANGLEVSR